VTGLKSVLARGKRIGRGASDRYLSRKKCDEISADLSRYERGKIEKGYDGNGSNRRLSGSKARARKPLQNSLLGGPQKPGEN